MALPTGSETDPKKLKRRRVEELRGALAERGVDVSPQKLSHLYSLYCRGDGKQERVEFANLCGTLTTEHCEEDSVS